MKSSITASLYGGEQGKAVGAMIDKFKVNVPAPEKPSYAYRDKVDANKVPVTTTVDGKPFIVEEEYEHGTNKPTGNTRTKAEGSVPNDQWVVSVNSKGKREYYDKAKKSLTGVAAPDAAGMSSDENFGNLSPQAKDTWFETYQTSGKLPPFAYRDAAGRNAFTKGYAEYLQRNGVTPTEAITSKVSMDALGGSLKVQQRALGMMGSFVNNLNAQVDKVKSMKDDIVKRVGVRALDLPMREWATRFKGSGAEQVLGSYLMEISNEIGKISTGSQASIAELSAEAQDRWNKVHDPNLSMGELIKVLDATKEQANIRKSGAQKELADTQEEMKNVGKKNPAPKQSTSGEKVRVRRKSDGQTGTINAGDFNADKYEKIQ